MVAKEEDPAYFLTLLRSGFPDIWEAVVDGYDDVVVCVPQASGTLRRRRDMGYARTLVGEGGGERGGAHHASV